LIHSDGAVLSARLNPEPFLSRFESDDRGSGGALCIDDMRRVDCHGSARAVPLGAAQPFAAGRIQCMCQDKDDRQFFATCDDQNWLSIWRWTGTDPADAARPALMAYGGPPKGLGADITVFQMCFLSNRALPARVVQQDGRGLVLLTHRQGSDTLYIEIGYVYSNAYYTETMKITKIVSASAERGSAEVTFFATSHSDRVLALGGRGLLQFWQICDTEDGRLDLRLIDDVATQFPCISSSTMESCLSIPLPPAMEDQDWMVIGASDGKMYGYAFARKPGGRIELETEKSGHFRGNTHTAGVPVRCLIGIFGSCPEAHHRILQHNQGLSYEHFLRVVQIDPYVFHSLGDDGKLVCWRWYQEGWTRTSERSILEPSPGMGRSVACHSSRLVPHITVVYDMNAQTIECITHTSHDESSELSHHRGVAA